MCSFYKQMLQFSFEISFKLKFLNYVSKIIKELDIYTFESIKKCIVNLSSKVLITKSISNKTGSQNWEERKGAQGFSSLVCSDLSRCSLSGKGKLILVLKYRSERFRDQENSHFVVDRSNTDLYVVGWRQDNKSRTATKEKNQC